MPRKKAFARRERGSRCLGLGRGFLHHGAADAGGEECGGRPQHKGSCVGQHTGRFTRRSARPLRVRRRPSLLSSGKYQGSVYVPLWLEIFVTGECLCSELHLCFAVTKIREGNCLQLWGAGVPSGSLTGWQIAFEKRMCQFSSLLAIESSSLLK